MPQLLRFSNFAAIKSAHKCESTNKVAVVKKKKENHQKSLWPFYYCSLMWESKSFAVVAWGFFDVNEDTFQ